MIIAEVRERKKGFKSIDTFIQFSAPLNFNFILPFIDELLKAFCFHSYKFFLLKKIFFLAINSCSTLSCSTSGKTA